MKKIKLSSEVIKYLSHYPEQGMGYQIVDVYLKSGIILKNRIVYNSTYLDINSDEDIDSKDIIKIVIS